MQTFLPYENFNLSLAFDHPITNERLKFSSNLPDDFKNCIDKWRAYSKYTK